MTGDVLQAFETEVSRARGPIQRLILVSPWLSFCPGRSVLGRLADRADRDGAALVLVTRPGTSVSHAAAIDRVRAMPRGRVLLNRRLHAKAYLCEQASGRGFALFGSANLTTGSADLDEVGLLVRPPAGSQLICELAPAIAHLGRRRRRRTAQRPDRGRRAS